jgi:hypothetical protein
MSWQQKEEFLQTANKTLKVKSAPGGITGTLRATMTNGKITHDVHVQSIDEQKAEFRGDRGTELNFRDTYKFNIAAWKLGQLLGLEDMIPPSVERKFQGKTSALTWWVDEVVADELSRKKEKMEPPDLDDWNLHMYKVRVFDQLIYNTDRNVHNLLTDKSWHMWMIDHTRAFRLAHTLQNKANLVKCDKTLFEKLKGLDQAVLEKELMPFVRKEEIKSMMIRRDLIVKFFEDEIKQKGEGAILYTIAKK